MKTLLVSACMAAMLGIPAIARAQDQYPYPPPAQDQYAPPPAQYNYPPPAQYQNPYPPPPQYGYPPVDAYGEPIAPAGAAWVGPPGECLYSYAARAVYWCAPGVVFTGFPAGWDFVRYPVVSIAPGIVVDPIWWEGWRRERPAFVFRGRFARDEERRAFIERRERFIRERGRGPERDRRPEERREERRDR